MGFRLRGNDDQLDFRCMEKLSVNLLVRGLHPDQPSNAMNRCTLAVTSDLVKGIWQHKNGAAAGFTKEFGVSIFVYWEPHEDLESAMFVKSSSRNGTANGGCD
jgi:hypothetical protein